MEVRLVMVPNDIARCMAPSGPTKAVSFTVVEIALRAEEAVRSVPQPRVQH